LMSVLLIVVEYPGSSLPPIIHLSAGIFVLASRIADHLYLPAPVCNGPASLLTA
jgi:hypothetical protein